MEGVGRDIFRVPYSILPRGWAGDSLKQAGKLKLPLGFLGAVAIFVLIQALIDRRDPKLSDAPERHADDTVGFD